jgi:hypothetical protein
LEERQAQFVLSTDIPLQLVREKETTESQLAELRLRLAQLRTVDCPYCGLKYFGKTGPSGRPGASTPAAKVHLVSVVRHESATVLAQTKVVEQHDERQAAKALFPCMPLAGRVMTMDALHTQRWEAETILAAGGHYLMVVKSNQRTLYQDIQWRLPSRREALPPLNRYEQAYWDDQRHQTHDRGHGRLEHARWKAGCPLGVASMTTSRGRASLRYCVARAGGKTSGTLWVRRPLPRISILASRRWVVRPLRWLRLSSYGAGTGRLKIAPTTFGMSPWVRMLP